MPQTPGKRREVSRLFPLPLPSALRRSRGDALRARGPGGGDTVYVLDAAKKQHKIRLAGIDAPERGQPFGTKSKERMADLVAGRDVEVNWYKEDRWGRLIGTVWVASPDCRQAVCPKTLDAGLALITSGLAWHFKRYAHEQTEEDRERYAFAEEEARARKAGLWRDPDPVPPWEWRRR
jgi:endonuclease YncB( thermonuclease family)